MVPGRRDQVPDGPLPRRRGIVCELRDLEARLRPSGTAGYTVLTGVGRWATLGHDGLDFGI
jgi:hypothetical protein